MALSQREKMLVYASGAVGFVCLNWCAAGPVLDAWRETQYRCAQSRMMIKSYQAVMAMEPQWQAQHRELLARLRQSSPGQTTADIIPRVEGLGTQLGFNFNQRAPSAPVPRGRYTEKAATFTFQGQWPGLIQFLFALTRQPEIYRVTSLRLRAESRDTTQLAGDMTVVTYYLGDNQAGSPAGNNPAEAAAAERQDKP